MRVRVHYNLNRGDFSVVNPKTRLVIGNVGCIVLENVTFHVSEKSRQRVIKRNCRSVHAYAIGTIAEDVGTPGSFTAAVTYNPYRRPHFHLLGQPDKPIWQADAVLFRGRYCWIKSTMK